MRVYQDHLELTPSDQGRVVTIGNFDGLHLGHRRLFREVRELAVSKGLRSLVFTFAGHSRQQEHQGLLQSLAEKTDQLERLGLDELLYQPFDQTFAAIEAEDFVRQVLIEQVGVRALVVGYNFRFGRQARGTPALLSDFAQQRAFSLTVIEPVRWEGAIVSSTAIRHLLLSGEVELARAYLGRPYRLTGEVLAGASRGRTLSYPTLNVYKSDCLFPRPGVYGGWARLKGADHAAIAYVGSCPTFREERQRLEVHLLDPLAVTEPKEVCFEFLNFVRPERVFADAEELKEQIARDIATVRERLSREVR